LLFMAGAVTKTEMDKINVQVRAVQYKTTSRHNSFAF
jgi:hypothetical protein